MVVGDTVPFLVLVYPPVPLEGYGLGVGSTVMISSVDVSIVSVDVSTV